MEPVSVFRRKLKFLPDNKTAAVFISYNQDMTYSLFSSVSSPVKGIATGEFALSSAASFCRAEVYGVKVIACRAKRMKIKILLNRYFFRWKEGEVELFIISKFLVSCSFTNRSVRLTVRNFIRENWFVRCIHAARVYGLARSLPVSDGSPRARIRYC